MSERDEFERWMHTQDRDPSLARLENGAYADPVTQIKWNTWQARADLAAERERRANAAVLLATRALSGDADAIRRLRRSASCAPEECQPLVDAAVSAAERERELEKFRRFITDKMHHLPDGDQLVAVALIGRAKMMGARDGQGG